MALPLMPKATAVWLVDNTTLTFEQIGAFCGMHSLEIQAIADGDVNIGMMGRNPIANGQLTAEEIKRCEADPSAVLQMKEPELPTAKSRSKGARYTPMAKRQGKPDAIAWILKHHPEIPDTDIRRLLGTTSNSINAIRNKTYKNISTVVARNPVLLGLCTETDLKKAIADAAGAVASAPLPLDIEDAEEPVD